MQHIFELGKSDLPILGHKYYIDVTGISHVIRELLISSSYSHWFDL